MLVYQLVLDFQGIHLLNAFRQFGNTGNAVQVHDTYHLGQHTGEVEVYHQQVAAEHTVGNVGILQHAAQTLNHHHAFGNFHRRFGQGVHLVYRGYGKLHTALLQLQIGCAPAVQQRIHAAETTTDGEARERSVRTPESYGEVGTVIGSGLQVVDVHSIQKGFQPFGNFHLLALLISEQMEYDFRRIAKVRTGKRKRLFSCRCGKRTVLLHRTADNAHILFPDIITARAVMFLSLYQRHRPTLPIISLRVRRSRKDLSVRQQTEEGIQFAQLALGCFKCHINSILIK